MHYFIELVDFLKHLFNSPTEKSRTYMFMVGGGIALLVCDGFLK